MGNESGDLKLLSNFRKPSITFRRTLTTNHPTARSSRQLVTQPAAALASAPDLPAKLTLNMAAISDREAAFC